MKIQYNIELQNRKIECKDKQDGKYGYGIQ